MMKGFDGMPIILSDNVRNSDSLNLRPGFRTEIIGGYDATTDKFGKTTFGKVLFKEKNMTVLGGSVFMLEKLFDMRYETTAGDSSTLQKTPDMATMLTGTIGSGYTDLINSNKFADTTYDRDANHLQDDTVCLFGIGRNGAGTSLTDVRDVKYVECGYNTIGASGVDFLPIRTVVNETDLGGTYEHSKYFIRSDDRVNSGYIYYFLKNFDSKAIYSRSRNASREGEGSLIELGNAYNTHFNDATPIETYIELRFSVSSDELNEYFDSANSSVEDRRVNSIYLFTGRKRQRTAGTDGSIIQYTDPDGVSQNITHEYDNVRLYSKLNFPNEVLQLDKTLTVLYRIFTS